MNEFLKNPVEPFQIQAGKRIDQILDDMGKISFQGRNLSRAFSVWQNMLEEDAFIFFGLAGAMIPAGMRKIVVYLIENRMIDCIVSTGANLFHDICETLGYKHYIGSPRVNDVELLKHGIDRIYDTFASEHEFEEVDKVIFEISQELDWSRKYTTREFLSFIGKKLHAGSNNSGVVSTAARIGIPIYCPAIADSSIGIALAAYAKKNDGFLTFDVVADVRETAEMVIGNEITGVIYISGGTPKNFIQQTEVTAPMISTIKKGHTYAIQITADSPHWGGLSGCTFEEAQSWGKIAKNAMMASVNCDATIALPIITSALAARFGDRLKTRPLKKYPY